MFLSDPWAKPLLDNYEVRFSLTTSSTLMEISQKKKTAACAVTALHTFTRTTSLRKLILAASIKLRNVVLAQKSVIQLM